MESCRTDKWDMPSSHEEITLFYSIIYNRKDWDYTLPRILPNQREVKTLRGNRKRILSVWKPKKDRSENYSAKHI